NWSVRRLKEAGADCIKILLYYNPVEGDKINDVKHAWVERIGDECRANDIPFFLEFVTYEEGADEKSLDYAKKKPERVMASMKEFSKDKYGVDVLKVEIPVNMKFVEGCKVFAGQKAYTKKEAMDWFIRAATAATKPFIYLSAGVSNAEFTESLALASESGVRFAGVLCGRATWKEGIPVYAKQGRKAFEDWMKSDGVNLVLVARSRGKLHDLAASLGNVQVHVVARDLAHPRVPQEIFDELQEKSITVDWLVNNAGFGAHGKFSELSLPDQLEMMQVNMAALV